MDRTLELFKFYMYDVIIWFSQGWRESVHPIFN